VSDGKLIISMTVSGINDRIRWPVTNWGLTAYRPVVFPVNYSLHRRNENTFLFARLHCVVRMLRIFGCRIYREDNRLRLRLGKLNHA